MEDEDKYSKPSKLWEWLEGNRAGRKIQRAIVLCEWLWHKHIDRYRLWDETLYRVYTWLVVIMATLVLAEGIKMGHRRYLHHEEIRAQLESENFLARGDYRNASLSANRALMFNPKNLAACQVMATLAEQANSPTVLDWLGRIAVNQPSLANKLNLAQAGLRYQQPPFAFSAGILKSVTPFATNDASYQEAAAKLEMGLHHFAAAEAHFATAVQLAPTNLYYTMSDALLQLLSTNRSTQIQGQAALAKLRTNASYGVFALRGLVADRVQFHDLATAKVYSSELVANPQASLADRLQDLGIMHQLKTPDFRAHLREIEQQVMKNEPAIAQVSNWMRANGLVEDNLEWMMTLPNSMLDRPQVQINRAMGYLQDTNWQRLREVASQGDWGDLEYLRFALVSHACAQLNAPEMADSNWQASMKEASSHLANMEHLLDLAEGWHLKHEREQLLLWMVRDFPDERWAQKLIQIYFSNGNTLGLHQLYGVLEEYYPTNTLCQNDLAATEMLMKINLNEAFELSEEAFSKCPTNATIAATYAFSLHMQDRDLQGLDVLKNLPPADLERPNVALYYGILLASAGRHEEARTWLTVAQNKGKFLPEERKLLATAWSQIGEPRPN